MSVTIIRLFPSGALECCAVCNGRLIRRVYYGHTMKEARRLFVEEITH